MPKNRAPREIDELDEQIFKFLQVKGRMPYTEIARELGVVEATVRKRVERMLRLKFVHIGAWAADPLAIGYRNYIIIDIQARPRDIERVAEQLAELPEIVFLGICTGAYNINAAAVFVSNDAMYKFMTHELSKVPGIERTQIANIIRVIKREHSLPILRV